MELIVVGCSGSVSGPASPATCYLLQAPYLGRTFSLLLDLGPGAFGGLYNYLDPSEVDAIALSHLHPDHCLDVCAFYVAARYSPTAPWPQRPVYGPRGTSERLARAYDVTAPGSGDGDPAAQLAQHFDFRDWQPQQAVGPFDVRTVRVDHPVEAYAVRIAEKSGSGRSLVYSGDTGPCDALTELARGVDVLLVEAAFMAAEDNPPGIHLTAREAAETGAAASVGAVVLTHIPPWHIGADVLAEAAPHFDGPLTLAKPGPYGTV